MTTQHSFDRKAPCPACTVMGDRYGRKIAALDHRVHLWSQLQRVLAHRTAMQFSFADWHTPAPGIARRATAAYMREWIARKTLFEAARDRQRAEFKRLGLSWEHWRCSRCHGHGKVEVTGTGQYDSDNDWVKCPETPPEDQWGPELLTDTLDLRVVEGRSR